MGAGSQEPGIPKHVSYDGKKQQMAITATSTEVDPGPSDFCFSTNPTGMSDEDVPAFSGSLAATADGDDRSAGDCNRRQCIQAPETFLEWTAWLKTCTSLPTVGIVLAWGWKVGCVSDLSPVAESSQRMPGSNRWRWLFPLPVAFPMELSRGMDVQQLAGDPEIVTNCWLAAVCCALNWQYGHRTVTSLSRSGKVHARAIEGLKGSINRMLAGSPGLQLQYEEVVRDLKNRKISYTGEEISQPFPLSVVQMMKGLPPKGHGGSISLQHFVKGRAKYLLENPAELILGKEDRMDIPCTARIHINRGEELDVFNLLYERGVITWADSNLAYKDEKGAYLSGLFGVTKPGKLTACGKPVLRCIMNLVPVNALLGVIEGDVSLLPNATSWLPLTIDGGEEIWVSQSDMQSAFYLFAVPQGLYPFLCFNFETSRASVGLSGPGMVRPCCRVLPMGWNSSVGLMQMVSREILLSRGLPPEAELHKGRGVPSWFAKVTSEANESRGWWQVYLDNFMSAEVGNSVPEGIGARLHKEAVDAWVDTGVLTAADKDVINSSDAVELGVRVDGVNGLLGASPERLLKTLLATFYNLDRQAWSKKHAQIILGRWIFILQFRRAGMGVFSRSWAAVEAPWPSRALVALHKLELVLASSLGPILQADLRLSYDDSVTVSDASETGGAAAVSKGLTFSGLSLVGAIEDERHRPIDIPVLVISAFNGIGGAFRIYDLLGLRPAGRISIDISKEANRVCRSTWPDILELHDIMTIDEKEVRRWANCYGRVKEVHLYGGFPCIHLSSVRYMRQGLSGEGSNLFWQLLVLIQLVQRIFGTFSRVKWCVENVSSMEQDARAMISSQLETQPIKFDPSDCMPFSRPRFAWISEPLFEMEGISLVEEQDYVRAYVTATCPSTSQWIRPNWSWPAEAEGAKFPTFMKSIKRLRPPPRPAGLERAGPCTRQRWQQDCFRYPPYQYAPNFLLVHPSKPPRVLDSSERELLLGFGAQHTASCMSASEMKKSMERYEDVRKSLCGDSFAMISFALVGAVLCQELAPRMSPQQIMDRLGLAPGWSAHPSIVVPLTRWLSYHGAPSTNSTASQTLVRYLGLTVNHTGSDVRILTGTPLGHKPTCHASVRAWWWQWKQLFTLKWNFDSHINFLEMQMILNSLLWKCRDPQKVGRRWLHLEDSMVCLSILTKGRTSSRLLQPLCNKIGALQMAMGSVLLHGHVGSAENPTDKGSRL